MVVVRSSKGFMTVPFQSHWLENRAAGKTCADIKMWKYAELGKLSKKEVMDFQSGHFPFIIFLVSTLSCKRSTRLVHPSRNVKKFPFLVVFHSNVIV